MKQFILLSSLVASFCFIGYDCFAQPSGSYSVSRGRNDYRYPRNYNSYYGRMAGEGSGYLLNPWLYNSTFDSMPQRPPVGPVEEYSSVDYGRVVMSTLNTDSVQPATSRFNQADSVLAGYKGGKATIEITVADILDRGIIQATTREEVRLKGVIIPSETDGSNVSRLYAHEAVSNLRQFLVGQTIKLEISDPVRDSEGRILANIVLSNGTNLNYWILANGYGSVRGVDFKVKNDSAVFQQYEKQARAGRLGIWSGR